MSTVKVTVTDTEDIPFTYRVNTAIFMTKKIGSTDIAARMLN
jgi:hypothetical protein